MIYGSVCSGIEAATVAWHPLGWRPAFFSEIEKFPSAVLAHHYPDVPNFGDLTQHRKWKHEPIDVLVGGTPCQSFSVAGLRKGLDDPRGNLALEFLALADRARPRWVVWENVPGVLSIDGGRAFGSIVGAMGQLGYGWAYRVLDAQYFGVPQRRRRVFVVGYLGDWRRAAAVLFERHSLSRNNPPRRKTGSSVAALAANGVGTCGADDNQGQAGHLIAPAAQRWPAEVTSTLNAHFGDKWGLEDQHALGGASMFVPDVAHSLRGEGFDASEDGTGRGTPLVPVAFPWQQGGTMAMSHDVDLCGTLVKNQTQAVAASMSVRRLTPRECERLQGFPDDYSLVPYRGKPAADGPRYKALGNSMAVPVMRWIGERIAAVDAIERGATFCSEQATPFQNRAKG